MENLYIASTETTPLVNFEVDTGIFELGGRSYCSDPHLFYKPVLEWIEAYAQKHPNKSTTLNVRLEQFDDESAKIMLYVFQKLGKLAHFKVNWFYDDIHILEVGEDLSYMGGASFNFVKTS